MDLALAYPSKILLLYPWKTSTTTLKKMNLSRRAYLKDRLPNFIAENFQQNE